MDTYREVCASRDLHENLNRRAAKALDKPFEGEGSSWHDIPECILKLKEDNACLKKWVGDLQAEIYVNCVYCGHRYGPHESTPTSQADILKEHIENCPEHPMAKLKKENDQLVELLDAAVGTLGFAVKKLVTVVGADADPIKKSFARFNRWLHTPESR